MEGEIRPQKVFVTGGTGLIGRALIPHLLERGHAVRALVRAGSQAKLPPGCEAVVADPFDSRSFAAQVSAGGTFVQLLGAHHPNPSKARQFREIDLRSAIASLQAAVEARAGHFLYLSVAQPAPIMQAYITVRAECEARIRAAGLNATFVRPWYVLGPGRRWPLALKPLYWLFERIPATREGALRLGLVTRDQMVATLVHAVEHPATGIRVVETKHIREARPD
jgi:uncharacterized protein YbjT (DUF2867 family)